MLIYIQNELTFTLFHDLLPAVYLLSSFDSREREKHPSVYPRLSCTGGECRASKFNFTSWLAAIASVLCPSVEITGNVWLLKKFPSSACVHTGQKKRSIYRSPRCLNGANRNGNNTPGVSAEYRPLSSLSRPMSTKKGNFRKKRMLFISYYIPLLPTYLLNFSIRSIKYIIEFWD